MWSVTSDTSFTSAATLYNPLDVILLECIGNNKCELLTISLIYDPNRYSRTSGDLRD